MILPVWLWAMLSAAAPCEPASGCVCAMGPTEMRFENAEAVFRGVVVRTETGDLSATRRWKGAAADTLVVDDVSICPIYFRKGEEFLVYASRAEDGRLKTSICSGTTLFARAAEDVRELDRIAAERQR